jgi:glucosamine--fructose-6-phosphate aminotransferase (isomerizing)
VASLWEEKVIEGTYLKDILDQPRAIRDTVVELEPLPGVSAGHRIVLTGMGGSYQILHPLHLRLTAAGLDSISVETSELLYSMPALLDERNTVLAVSQSGASAEIVRLLDACPVHIAVTNTPSSQLATRSYITVLTQAGDEGGVSCKTAVTSLVALYWIGEHLAGADIQRALHLLAAAPRAVEMYLSRWQEHVARLKDTLQGIQRVFFAGRGASLSAAGLGAMVQKEAAHFHGEGMSSAALRHGPFEMLGPDSFVLVFEGDKAVRHLNERLVRDVLETGARAALCGFSVAEGPFALPRADAAIRPILELLPAQMMSLALADLQGREPGRFERITKVTTVE